MSFAQTQAKWISGLLLIVTAAGAMGADFEFRFWPAPGAEKDPRFIRFDDGPCGQVATARVRTMPRYSKAEIFAPERVLELNGRGEVIRQWGIPVDATPYALDGNDLLFAFSELSYRVSTTRVISELKGQTAKQSPAPEPVQCVTPKEFEPSDYVGCWQIKDRRSGNKRLLAFEGVCT
jgi:hypothetical protein